MGNPFLDDFPELVTLDNRDCVDPKVAKSVRGLEGTGKVQYQASRRQHSPRVDIVWDAYTPDSLKESTREKRGLGLRRKVSGTTKLPPNWSQFLRDPTNKTELFGFLSSKGAGVSVPAGKALYITSGKCGQCGPMPHWGTIRIK